ncbi:MAG TPA: hypothetical protein VE934_09040 [Polaromonas sp.]|uniref:hypothetical protein n=1 Tax=Polaromonas sp. TaxID=1869339 RepID=UPI002D5E0DF5|nr:hypothetical protein [Polaromonas sp.]HYW57094.1 hypothetical protein [Polaromonas sp.]
MFELEKNEGVLLGVVLALLAAAIFGPFVAQPGHLHGFADQRSWWGIACTMDVLSNLPFALWGVLGLACLVWKKRDVSVAQKAMAALFFVGLLVTAGASSWYHWQADDAGLAIDRLGMVLAFAGLLGLAAADRISSRAGMVLGLAVLVLGPLSVAVWFASGNVLAWAALQFGGMALVLWLACVKPVPGALAVRWGWVIVIYAIAKLFEQTDEAVYALSAQLVSGHSIKHVIASFAAVPVIAAILDVGKNRAESASPFRGGLANRAATRAGHITTAKRSQA